MTAVGDLLELSYGKALKESDRDGGEVPVVGSGGIVGGHSTGITDSPTIVVGRKGSIGSVTWIDGPAWPIDTAYFVKPKRDDLDRRWAFWMLRSLRMETMNKSAAVPGLNRDDVYRIDIALPSLAQQLRIAAVLDQAEALREKRRKVLTHLDGLGQAIFHDMFGNETHDMVRLEEVAAVSSGITKGRRTTGVVEPVPYLAVANVQAGYLNLDVVKEIPATAAEIERYALRDGDLVLTEGGDPDKLGRGTVWREQLPLCIHQNHIFRVRPNEQHVLPDYLSAALAGIEARAHFLRSAKQTTGIASINMTQLRATPVSVPPIEHQRAFLERLAALEQRRVDGRCLVAAHDELFMSLQSRAFRGEL